jgi:hypothetical protein
MHAIQLAVNNGFNCMRIKSDPHAESYYKGFGEVVVREASSTVRPDMLLPVMHLSL